jgi:hypothetical protein
MTNIRTHAFAILLAAFVATSWAAPATAAEADTGAAADTQTTAKYLLHVDGMT